MQPELFQGQDPHRDFFSFMMEMAQGNYKSISWNQFANYDIINQ